MKQTTKSVLRPNADGYFAISPLMIFPGSLGRFSVFLRQKDEYVLYTSADATFTERHKRTLYANDVDEVYIHLEQKEMYTRYIESNLGSILQNESIPLKERAGVLYRASNEILIDLFESRLPGGVDSKMFARMQHFTEQAVKFLSLENSLKAIANFIAHDYKTYSHCLNVFVYTTAILKTYDFDDELLTKCGMGAMLHDIGKTRIPKAILDKPGRLDPDERRIVNTHSALGLASCTQVPVPPEAMQIILFHHEKMNGSGYPTGLMGEEIPLYVKAVTVADIFDALSSDRPYAKGRSAFEVLDTMRNEMDQELDLDVFKRLILVLSTADMIG